MAVVWGAETLLRVQQNPRVLQNLWGPQSLLRDWLRNQSSGSEKNCIGHNLFCIFIIMVVIIPSFVVLLNCLYLNPGVLLFVCSPLHPAGRKERATGCVVLVAGCQDKPRQHISVKTQHSTWGRKVTLPEDLFMRTERIRFSLLTPLVCSVHLNPWFRHTLGFSKLGTDIPSLP